MDNPATQNNNELSTKHRTKKTDREIKNGQSSDSDNSELNTTRRTKKNDREIKNGQYSDSENSELSTKHRTKKKNRVAGLSILDFPISFLCSVFCAQFTVVLSRWIVHS
jgi:hypothetical protein